MGAFKDFLNEPVATKHALAAVGLVSVANALTMAAWFHDVDLAKKKIAGRDQANAIQSEILKILLDDEEHPPHPDVMQKIDSKLDFWRVIQEKNIAAE